MATNNENQPPRRKGGPGRRFQKGQSGNPAGVPKGIAEIKAMHLPYGEEALLKLVSLMRTKPSRVSFHAAKEILDRILGRTRLDIGGPDGGPVKLDLDVLSLLQRLVERNE